MPLASRKNRRLSRAVCPCLAVLIIEGLETFFDFTILVSDDLLSMVTGGDNGLVVKMNGIPNEVLSVVTDAGGTVLVHVSDPLAAGDITVKFPGTVNGIRGTAGGTICPHTGQGTILV
jgi:hypothetical protein